MPSTSRTTASRHVARVRAHPGSCWSSDTPPKGNSKMTAHTPDYSVPDYLQQLRLDGKNFVVLGAGQGIGEATTHALAQAGARVLCVDREEDLAVRIAEA